MVAATCDAEGAVVVDPRASRPGLPPSTSTSWTPRAAATPFSAGLVIGLGLGRSPREAAVLGCASAALVAGGLGSNHGDFDHDTADALAAATPCGR